MLQESSLKQKSQNLSSRVAISRFADKNHHAEELIFKHRKPTRAHKATLPEKETSFYVEESTFASRDTAS